MDRSSLSPPPPQLNQGLAPICDVVLGCEIRSSAVKIADEAPHAKSPPLAVVTPSAALTKTRQPSDPQVLTVAPLPVRIRPFGSDAGRNHLILRDGPGYPSVLADPRIAHALNHLIGLVLAVDPACCPAAPTNYCC